jgi:hypothetical protein
VRKAGFGVHLHDLEVFALSVLWLVGKNNDLEAQLSG